MGIAPGIVGKPFDKWDFFSKWVTQKLIKIFQKKKKEKKKKLTIEHNYCQGPVHTLG